MAKKEIPAWQLMGLDGPPPVVRGYHNYGVVFHADWPRRRFHWHRELINQTRWAIWSYYYWGKKVRRSLRYAAIDVWGLVRGRPWPPRDSPAEVKKPASVD